MKSCLSIVSILVVLSLTSALPAPNDLKAKFIEENEIPAKHVAKGVSAEWGGYRASAGLGGSAHGGALFANAEAPGTNANAGVFSSGSAASAGSSSYSNNYGERPEQQGGFFDRIFNIPISVLQSVNSYVKTKGKNGEVIYTEVGHGAAGAGAGAGASAGVGASASAGGSDGAIGAGIGTETRFASADGASAASASASVGHGHHKHIVGRPDYDRIFDIPITALRSVNGFLSG